MANKTTQCHVGQHIIKLTMLLGFLIITIFGFLQVCTSPVLNRGQIIQSETKENCSCVRVNSCSWSRNLQEEIRNIKTNFAKDIKEKRQKAKEIKNHWCTLENGHKGKAMK